MTNKNNLLTAINVFLQEIPNNVNSSCRLTIVYGKNELNDVCSNTHCTECPFNTNTLTIVLTPITITRHIKED